MTGRGTATVVGRGSREMARYGGAMSSSGAPGAIGVRTPEQKISTRAPTVTPPVGNYQRTSSPAGGPRSKNARAAQRGPLGNNPTVVSSASSSSRPSRTMLAAAGGPLHNTNHNTNHNANHTASSHIPQQLRKPPAANSRRFSPPARASPAAPSLFSEDTAVVAGGGTRRGPRARGTHGSGHSIRFVGTPHAAHASPGLTKELSAVGGAEAESAEQWVQQTPAGSSSSSDEQSSQAVLRRGGSNRFSRFQEEEGRRRAGLGVASGGTIGPASTGSPAAVATVPYDHSLLSGGPPQRRKPLSISQLPMSIPADAELEQLARAARSSLKGDGTGVLDMLIHAGRGSIGRGGVGGRRSPPVPGGRRSPAR